MKKYLSLIFILISAAALAQPGSLKQSGYFTRVQDSATYRTAATSAHSSGYSDIYWNDQATTPHYDIWNGASYDHVFGFNGGTSGPLKWFEATGTNAYTADGPSNFDILENVIFLKFENTNSASSSVTVNGFGPITIMGWDGDEWAVLPSGFLNTDRIYRLDYNTTEDYFQIETVGLVDGQVVTALTGATSRITIGGTAIVPNVDIASDYVGQASITTTGTLTSGATGAGFTVALGTSTVTGTLPDANTGKNVLESATTVTTGGTITLDMAGTNGASLVQKILVGATSFATAKVMAMSNTTNSLVFNFHFEVTNVAAVLTAPSDWVMADPNFDGADWTPPATGQYEMGGTWDGTNWKVKIAGPFQ